MAATEEQVKEAKTMGWAPKEEWRGDASQWVDADVYVERGRNVLPILRHTNEKLTSQVQTQQAEIAELRRKVEDGESSMEEFKKFHGEELRRQVEKTRRELRVEIETARKDGDVEGAVDLQEQLDKLDETTRGMGSSKENAAGKDAAGSGEEKKTDPHAAKPHPDFDPWLRENPWYGQDPVKTSLMNGMAAKLREDGSKLIGRAFFDEAAKQMDLILNPRSGASKVEGAGGHGGSNGGSGGGGGGGEGFDSLPAEAQAFAKSEARKYVGEGKMFKKEQDWLDYYAAHYEV